MNNKNKANRGFTLIELLVVIAILAILMVVVVITLNPSELLKQSRDSNRLSDMATLKTAISLFQTDVATTSATALGTAKTCYNAVTTTGCTAGTYFQTVSATVVTSSRAIDSTGWIPVNFNAISSGAPINQLPVDPINTGTSFYAYEASGTALFKLTMTPESVKFSKSGSGDVTTNDGGPYTSIYEAGPGAGAL